MLDFWVKKTVLITGADGFIGSHLVEFLQNKGAKIRALVLYNSFNSWGWLDKNAQLADVEVIPGDIRDAENCCRLTEGIDIIFHLAALISVPYSAINPRSFIDTNITGTFNICQAAKKSNSTLIYISSSEVYGSAQYLPIDEKHPLQAQSPYSASKISAEAIVYSFCKCYNLNAVIARPFNTYGPRQSARAIVPSIIIQLAGGKTTIQLGNMSPQRDMNFVTDTCNGLALLAEREGIAGEAVNIGSGKSYSVSEIFALTCKLMGKEAAAVTDPLRIRQPGYEVDHLLCDNSKIKKLTGFAPCTGLEEGLKKTIEWFITPGNTSLSKSNIYHV